jgi:hypothetical protein
MFILFFGSIKNLLVFPSFESKLQAILDSKERKFNLFLITFVELLNYI